MPVQQTISIDNPSGYSIISVSATLVEGSNSVQLTGSKHPDQSFITLLLQLLLIAYLVHPQVLQALLN